MDDPSEERHIWHETQRGPVFARHWGDPCLPKLLMLHGFPEYSGAWSDLAPLLAPHFHCIAPDQRGYGQTGGPDDVAAYRTSALVTDMVDLLGGQQVSVLGHDWGASVAYGLAMFHPDLVSRLIIMNGVHPVPFQRALVSGGAQSAASQYIKTLRADGSEAKLSQDNFAGLMRLFSASMDLTWLTPAKRVAYLAEWARAGRLKTMIHWYRASPLRVAAPNQPFEMPDLPLVRLNVPQPHLLLWAENDTALLPESTQDLETFAPHLIRRTLHGVDHWAAHQNPQAIANEILNWRQNL